jgi:hypothetical protein
MNYRNLKKLVLVTVPLLMSPLSLVAFADGNSSGGGGDVERATAADVREAFAFQNAPSRLIFAFCDANFTRSVPDPELKALFQKMTCDAVSDDLSQTPPVEFKEGACPSAVGPKPSSVKENKLHSPICVSLSLLTSVPKEDVKHEAVTLLAHEISHHFGADEALADKVKKFYSGWLVRSQPVYALAWMNSEEATTLKELLSGLQNGTLNSTEICTRLGYISGVAFSYTTLRSLLRSQNTGGAIDYRVENIDHNGVRSAFVNRLKFCDPLKGWYGNPSLPEVAQGDKKALIESLNVELKALEEDEKNLPVRPITNSAK